jgi:hypothetical protein
MKRSKIEKALDLETLGRVKYFFNIMIYNKYGGYQDKNVFKEYEDQLRDLIPKLKKPPENWVSFKELMHRSRLASFQHLRKFLVDSLFNKAFTERIYNPFSSTKNSHLEDILSYVQLFKNENGQVDFYVNSDYVYALLDNEGISVALPEDMLKHEMYDWLVSEFKTTVNKRLIWEYVNKQNSLKEKIPDYTTVPKPHFLPKDANKAWNYFKNLTNTKYH